MYMRPQECYAELLTDEVIDRNPPLFGRLVGREVPTGWASLAEARRITELRVRNAARHYLTRGPHA
jgi:hypothetical protein